MPNSTPAEREIALGKRRAAQLPVLSNALLTVLKLTIVAVTGSVSVLAEAVNSAGDLFGSTISYTAVRAADTPPDEAHAYGHGKFENLTSVVIAAIIIAGASYTLREAMIHLQEHAKVRHALPAIAVMVFSALVNIGVSRRLFSVGTQYDSPALIADARHLRTDIITSTAILVSLCLTRITGQYWIDPATAIVVTVMVFWIGMQIMRDAVQSLADISLPANEERLMGAALSADPRVLGYHKLRTRKAGSHRHIDVHIMVDDRVSFIEAHEISEELEDRLRALLPNTHPIIHIEPFEVETQHQRAEREAQERIELGEAKRRE
jgi:cation diffusion facilitator family transporter